MSKPDDTIAIQTTTIDGQPVTVGVPDAVYAAFEREGSRHVDNGPDEDRIIGAIKRDLARRGWGYDESASIGMDTYGNKIQRLYLVSIKHRPTFGSPREVGSAYAPSLLGAWVDAYTEAVRDG